MKKSTVLGVGTTLLAACQMHDDVIEDDPVDGDVPDDVTTKSVTEASYRSQ